MQDCRRELEVNGRRAPRLGCIGGDSSPSFPRIAGGLKVAQAQAMAVAVGFMPDPTLERVVRRSPLLHRASFHGRGDTLYPFCH